MKRTTLNTRNSNETGPLRDSGVSLAFVHPASFYFTKNHGNNWEKHSARKQGTQENYDEHLGASPHLGTQVPCSLPLSFLSAGFLVVVSWLRLPYRNNVISIFFLLFEEQEQGRTEGGITRNRKRTKQKLVGRWLMSPLPPANLLIKICFGRKEGREDMGF